MCWNPQTVLYTRVNGPTKQRSRAISIIKAPISTEPTVGQAHRIIFARAKLSTEIQLEVLTLLISNRGKKIIFGSSF